ncbi:hypothetical protein [uncultured Winogradskyella sp.]|uniref:hypothetical protein n=1 Tax=uncultured Winogradskyella sp. TaxID=395353 RepID=UPI0026214493|nr:hypothetical protein [uncultured Winogradskyella sp.]
MRIFNASRLKMLKSKRLKNYMLYALGEIILVVLGILIALKVNNNNLENQKQQQLLGSANRVLELMQKDNSDIDDVLKHWVNVEKTIDTVLVITKATEPIVNCESCLNLLLSIKLPELDDEIVQLISNEDLSNSELDTTLKAIAKDYKSILITANFYKESSTEVLKDHLGYLKENYAWFAQYVYNGICDEACQEYHNNSSDYRNKVAYLNFILYDSYQYDLLVFKDRLKNYISKLKSILNN